MTVTPCDPSPEAVALSTESRRSSQRTKGTSSAGRSRRPAPQRVDLNGGRHVASTVDFLPNRSRQATQRESL